MTNSCKSLFLVSGEVKLSAAAATVITFYSSVMSFRFFFCTNINIHRPLLEHLCTIVRVVI